MRFYLVKYVKMLNYGQLYNQVYPVFQHNLTILSWCYCPRADGQTPWAAILTPELH